MKFIQNLDNFFFSGTFSYLDIHSSSYAIAASQHLRAAVDQNSIWKSNWREIRKLSLFSVYEHSLMVPNSYFVIALKNKYVSSSLFTIVSTSSDLRPYARICCAEHIFGSLSKVTTGSNSSVKFMSTFIGLLSGNESI